MNKKDVLILVGSLICVAFLGYFTYSTISMIMKDKTTSQEVSKNNSNINEHKNDTDSENKDKDSNSESSLNNRLEDTPHNSNNASDEDKNTNDNNSQSPSGKDDTSTSNKINNTNLEKENKNTNSDDSEKTSSSEEKDVLTFSAYLDDIETEKYTLKEEESLSDVAKKFKDTCAVNSSLNILKSLNQLNNVSALETGDTILVPVSAFEDGIKHIVKEGDTWYNLAREHYPNYNHEVVIDFLMDVNPFSNEILPLGEEVFLPKL